MDNNNVYQPVVQQNFFEGFTELTEEQRFEEGLKDEKDLKAFQKYWDHLELLTGEKKENPLLKKVEKAADVPAQPVEDERDLGWKERRARRKEKARQEKARAEQERLKTERTEKIHNMLIANIQPRDVKLHEEKKDLTGFPDLHFYMDGSYDDLINTQKEIIKGHAGYAANKELVDRIFLDMVKLVQENDRIHQICGAYTLVQYAPELLNDADHDALQRMVTRELDVAGSRSEILTLRIANLQGCIRYLTRHTDETNLTMQVLSEYTTDAAFEELKKQKMDDARAYLDIIKAEAERNETKEEKEKRHAGMFKELLTIDEREMGKAVRDTEKQMGIVNFAVAADELLRLSPEEKKKIFVKPENLDMSDGVFVAITEAKLETIKIYGKIARARLILRAVKSSASIPPQELMTEEELENYMKGFESGSGADLLAAFARDMIAEAHAELEQPQRKLCQSDAVFEHLSTHRLEAKLHKDCFSYNGDFIEKYNALCSKRGEELKAKLSKNDPEYVNFQLLYEGGKSIYLEAREKLANADWVREHPDEVKEQEDIVKYVPVYVGVSATHYRLAGAKEQLIGEAFARSFTSSQQYDSFRSMKDEEYTDMMDKIATGTFLSTDAPEEEKERARAVQKEGLAIYYSRTLEHYNMLEKRFGYEVPGLDFIIKNIDDIMQLTANIQVDVNMVTHDTLGLDMKNPDHVRLSHLVKFYNQFFGWILTKWSLTSYTDRAEDVYSVVDEAIKRDMEESMTKLNLKEDLDWLKSHRA